MARVCPSCSKECGHDHSFCPYCGTFVPQPDTCPTCGHEFMEDHAFCPHCGTPKGANEEEGALIPLLNACPSCGHEYKEDHAFCPHCGTPKQEKASPLPYCPHCGNELSSDCAFCPHCGNSATGKEPILQYREADTSYMIRNPYNSIPSERMAWYKFIIYFQLFASAAACLINAISIFATEEIQRLSKYVDGFESLQAFYFITMLCLCVFAIIARTDLADYKERGPKLYIGCLCSNAAVTLIYVIWLNILLSDTHYEINNTFSIIAIITNIVMAIANFVYFEKRAHLFIN